MSKPAVKPIRTVMMSLWRNDMERNLAARIDHLLQKVGVDRWVWLVGNSDDATEQYLREVAATFNRITVVRFDSDVLGDSPNERLLRLSETADAGLATVQADDDFWCVHESDLVSPMDIVPQLLTMQKHPCGAAGWPVLGEMFYDIWAYRKDGLKFTNYAPYHPCYVDHVFEVDSAGSVLLFPAEAIRKGARFGVGGMVELCARLKDMGYPIYVDPHLRIEQPGALWTSQAFPSV